MNPPLHTSQIPILPLPYAYPNHHTAPEQLPTSPRPTHTSTPAFGQTFAMTKTFKSYPSPPLASKRYTSLISTMKNHATIRHSLTQLTESPNTSIFQQEASLRETSTPTIHGGTP